MKISLLFLLFSHIVFSQTTSYEEIALKYFTDSIIPGHYKLVEDFQFSGKVDDSEPMNSICMKLDYIENFDLISYNKIEVSKFHIFSKRIGIFKRLFQPWKKRRAIQVYKHYPLENNNAVVIRSTSKNGDDFFSILIKSSNNEVLSHCLTSYDF